MASMPRYEREQRRGDKQIKKRKQGKRCNEDMQQRRQERKGDTREGWRGECQREEARS